jgi:hypothetical protein
MLNFLAHRRKQESRRPSSDLCHLCRSVDREGRKKERVKGSERVSVREPGWNSFAALAFSRLSDLDLFMNEVLS